MTDLKRRVSRGTNDRHRTTVNTCTKGPSKIFYNKKKVKEEHFPCVSLVSKKGGRPTVGQQESSIRRKRTRRQGEKFCQWSPKETVPKRIILKVA